MSEEIKNDGPKKGFRNGKKPNKNQRLDEMETMLQNIQMATRVAQMGMQQMGTSLQTMEKDIGGAMGVLNDLQYRTLAMLQLMDIDKDKLEDIAEGMKLKDFTDASDKEDAEKNYTIIDTVDKESIVIIASECEEKPELAIFRSKFKLDESGNKTAMESFVGKKVGDKFDFDINGNKHIIEIIGARAVPVVAEVDVLNEELPEDLQPQCEGACEGCAGSCE